MEILAREGDVKVVREGEADVVIEGTVTLAMGNASRVGVGGGTSGFFGIGQSVGGDYVSGVTALVLRDGKILTSASWGQNLGKGTTLLAPESVAREAANRLLKQLVRLQLDVDESYIKALYAMLKAHDPKEVEKSLKALRSLNAPSAVPEILPVLKSDNASNIRDACRTLAVLGNKDVIPAIEPLLQHPDPAVQKDAGNAIAALRDKP